MINRNSLFGIDDGRVIVLTNTDWKDHRELQY